MDYTFYLYPGNNISVSVAAKWSLPRWHRAKYPRPARVIIPRLPMPPQAPDSPSDNGTTGERE